MPCRCSGGRSLLRSLCLVLRCRSSNVCPCMSPSCMCRPIRGRLAMGSRPVGSGPRLRLPCLKCLMIVVVAVPKSSLVYPSATSHCSLPTMSHIPFHRCRPCRRSIRKTCTSCRLPDIWWDSHTCCNWTVAQPPNRICRACALAGRFLAFAPA